MKQRGFTLLEVIIAMMILTFLSIFTVEAIQRALRTRTKIQHDIDKNATLRDALRIIERDINMAFNYRDPSIELYNQAQEERKKAMSAPSPTPQPNPSPGPAPTPTPVPSPNPALDAERFKLKTEKIYTQFIGTEDQLDFTSLSNVRMTEDAPVSSQAEIGYKIKSCRRRSTQEQASKCLWRRVSNYIHEDITKEGQETVLLENVTEFRLRYLGPDKGDEWLTAWSSSEGADDVTRGKFPYAVEVTIEIKDPDPKAKDKTLRMTTVAAIRNPNNPKPKTPTGVPGANPQTP